MKSRISPYIQAERLLRENAAIEIANLIVNNERLLNACKRLILYHNQYDPSPIHFDRIEQAIKQAEGKQWNINLM